MSIKHRVKALERQVNVKVLKPSLVIIDEYRGAGEVNPIFASEEEKRLCIKQLYNKAVSKNTGLPFVVIDIGSQEQIEKQLLD